MGPLWCGRRSPSFGRYVDLHAHATKRGCFAFGNALDSERQVRSRHIALAIRVGCAVTRPPPPPPPPPCAWQRPAQLEVSSLFVRVGRHTALPEADFHEHTVLRLRGTRSVAHTHARARARTHARSFSLAHAHTLAALRLRGACARTRLAERPQRAPPGPAGYTVSSLGAWGSAGRWGCSICGIYRTGACRTHVALVGLGQVWAFVQLLGIEREGEGPAQRTTGLCCPLHVVCCRAATSPSRI